MQPTQGREYALWYWALPLAWLGLGGVLGQVSPIGLLLGSLFVLWLACGPRIAPWLWRSVTLLSSLALAAHLLPGFTPLPLSEPLAWSPDAHPVLLRLSWDKVLAGLGLLAWWLQQSSYSAPHWKAALLVSLLTLLLVPLAALGLGVVSWQPKWPEQLALWLVLNLGGGDPGRGAAVSRLAADLAGAAPGPAAGHRPDCPAVRCRPLAVQPAVCRCRHAGGSGLRTGFSLQWSPVAGDAVAPSRQPLPRVAAYLSVARGLTRTP